ncbi:hypothetical protein BALAC2494_01942 [Bifidobacterium animalis subsp. lactis CNCM I-2494]|uniref:Uncharacterized protein n=1 Tax=Bifidobacterium animalis subsp. lactis CNCM I-2494 TaxID=1042403 RepID=A0A806FRM6_BIFAN|nr:hypothetical protein BALAC2494_01942 [Bifidobacterium animalis subsp. lactis CNCM I-2494]
MRLAARMPFRFEVVIVKAMLKAYQRAQHMVLANRFHAVFHIS